MKKPMESASAFAKYSSMGIQMIAIIGVFAFLGSKLDAAQQTQDPLYTAGFSLIGVFISLYLVIRGLKSASKSDTENK